MAREFALVQCSIWDPDSDFLDLSPLAQHLYLSLITRRVPVSGLYGWHPKRMAAAANGLTLAHVTKAAAELESKRYVVFDEDTDQLLVRSFARNNTGLWQSWKTAEGMIRQLKDCGSRKLYFAAIDELRRLRQDKPELPIWRDPKVGDRLAELIGIEPPTPTPSKGPSVEAPIGVSDRASHRGNETTWRPGDLETEKPNPPTSGSLSRSRADAHSLASEISTGFDEFWAAYPNKRGKQAARRAYAKALKLTGADVLTAAAGRYAADPNRDDTYTPYPQRWLNEGRWEDAPLPQRPATALRADLARAKAADDVIARLQAEDPGNVVSIRRGAS